MAAAGEEDVEYESDPEEAKRSLAMRRREASDDEEGEGDGRDKRVDRPGIHSDDSDGQGGVAEYDDEEELDGEEEEEEEVDEDEEVEEGDEVEEEEAYKERGDERDVHGAGVDGSAPMVQEAYGDVRTSLEDTGEVHSGSRDDEEKKENEPFAVPTAGAFYMHDDRFRDNAGGRHRRTHGGRRLWESKDDRKWGHDKFEEMTLQERHYEEGRRSSKGNYRGRGKNRGIDRGYVQGNRKVYNNSSNQSQIPKGGVRGRGPRKYEPTLKRNGPALRMQNKQSGRPSEKTSHASSGRTFTSTSNAESDPAPARKQVFASSLNSASPPFYPSSSSNKDINLAPKRDVQAGSTSRNVRPSVMDEGFAVQQTNTLHRGKNVIESLSMDKLYIDESISPGVGKPLNNKQMPLSGTSGVNASQSHPRAPAKGVTIPVQMSYQLTPSDNQVNKVSPVQLQATQKNSVPIRTQTSVQAPAPQLGQRPGSGSQASSPSKSSVARDSLDSGEMDASSESGKSKGALVGKGKGGAPGNGRGSFLYSNAQLMGAAGNMVGHGDQNFPAFLPVMQFGGQHPGGMGVPAVGMAFPGYVANPQLGVGNSEMTWLPVLAGAAGALGATYCSPYLAVDGAYHTRQSGQTSASGASSKENNTNKANNELKPSERPELVNNEFGQRQNKPRRYSEMNFGQ